MDVSIRERGRYAVNPVHLDCHDMFDGIGSDDQGVRCTGGDYERSRIHRFGPAANGERDVSEMGTDRRCYGRGGVFSGPKQRYRFLRQCSGNLHRELKGVLERLARFYGEPGCSCVLLARYCRVVLTVGYVESAAVSDDIQLAGWRPRGQGGAPDNAAL
jgi:hypothetical protein